MAGVRRVSNKATPVRSAKRLLGQELGSLFLRSRASFYKAKNLATLKKIAKLKTGPLYKALRSKILKKRAILFPKSDLLVPFENPLYPLLGFWEKFGLNLSERESSFFSSAKAPSFSTLVKTVSVLEKASLVIYGTAKASTKKNQALVEGPLALLKGGGDKNDLATPSSGGSGLVLSYIVEDGFVELWPNIDLRPLTLTLIVFSPTACLT